MPVLQTLSLTVNQPAANATVIAGQPFTVSGLVFDQGPPEPHLIDSVTVQVDSGPVVRAALAHVKNQTATEISFHASAVVTGGQDPHTVTVIATDDQGSTVKQTRHVFTGEVFAVDAPAVVVDVLSPRIFEAGKILDQTIPIQQGLTGLSDSLATIGKLIAGPNFEISNSTSIHKASSLRVGFWIEDTSFPVEKRDNFPLPVLSSQAAALGFKLAPAVPVPPVDLPDGIPVFGISLPLGTIQKLVAAVAQDVKDAASAQDVTLDSITVNTISPESVATRFAGKLPFGVPFDITVTEVLGLKQLPNATPLVPAVISSSHSSSLGSALDLIIAAIFKPFRAALLLEFIELQINATNTDQQVTGLMQPLVAGLPPRFPIRSSLIPFDTPNPPDFPVIILDWKAFRSTSAGILGNGVLTVEARNQSEVGVSIDGPHLVTGLQGELSGNVRIKYGFSLNFLAPDPDKFTWHVAGPKSSSGSIQSTFGLGGSFTAVFPLPLHASPGKYNFTLTVAGTETSDTHPKNTLSASTSMVVVLEVKSVRNPQ